MMKNSTTSKPIVLLAFANDKQDSGAGFLRGLTTERNGIRDALMRAEENEWCQVIVEPDVTIDRIFDIFQHKNYKDRIAIFHYGGHADSFELLLESASGAKSVAHSEGLVPFLARQRGLKLVFLNGCCSEAQAQQLSDAGVPAVVGTSRSIDDEVATGLSIRFYKGLAAGSLVERSWEEAIDQLKTERGSDNFRSIRLREEDNFEDAATWKLLFREDAEMVKSWSLPEAAQDPLFGLELPADCYRRLPRQPFPGLRAFQPEEAALFYGRGTDIRNLYAQITGTQSAILLTGKAAVGKSSLLQAGLGPRIEGRYTVKYFRCLAEGLTHSLRQALQELCEKYELPPVKNSDRDRLQDKITELQHTLVESAGFAREVLEEELEKLLALNDEIQQLPVHWRRIEEKTGRPLLLLLDQSEAPFPSFPTEREEDGAVLNDFLQTLQDIYSQSGQPPQGKLLLSYREEVHRTIRDAFQNADFPYSEYFLRPLDRAGIIRAVKGIHRHPNTKDKYKLVLEESNGMHFPEIIADDLLEDQESPVAPVLQIVLSKMWETAVQENAKAPCFAVPTYLAYKQSGGFLSDFYSRQMDQLQQWQDKVVTSGLVLDLLYRHTTPSGAPKYLSLDNLHDHIYRDRRPLLDQLIARCRDLYLLTDVELKGTTLLHSFLSPVIIREFSISVLPGQQAARILNQKKAAGNEPLDDIDLQLVESGLEGMRSLTSDEEELLRISRENKALREKRRRRNRSIWRGLVTVVFLFAVLAGILWRVSQHRLIESRSNELAFLAKETLQTDNTQALDIAREAYALRAQRPEATAAQTLAEVFHSQEQRPFYALSLSHEKNVNSAVFSPDGAFLLTASEDGFAILWDTLGDRRQGYPHNRLAVQSAAFSPNGDQLLTLSGEVVRLWDKGGNLIDSLSLSPDQAAEASLENFSTDGARILTSFTTSGDEIDAALVDSLKTEYDRLCLAQASQRILLLDYLYGGTVRLCDWTGQILKDSLAQDVFWIDFSPDGKQFLTVSVQGDTSSVIRVWDQDGRFLFDSRYPNSVTMAVFSPDGRKILTAAKDQTAKLWDFSRPILHRLPNGPTPIGAVLIAAFSPDGEHMLTASYDYLVRLWDKQGNLIDSLPHRGVINSAVFSADGRRVLSAARDSIARLWTPDGAKLVLLPHDGEVDFACFSPDGRRILTAAQDSTARLWTANGVPIDTFRLANKVAAAHFSPDSRRVLTVSPRDSAAILWSESGDSLQSFRHRHEIVTACFSPDGRRILTAANDSTARLWSVKGDSLALFKHNNRVDLAVFSPDGRRILTSSQGEIHIWNDQGRRLTTYAHSLLVASLVFSKDGKEILTASADGSVQLRNFQGELLARYQKNNRPLSMACFSPDDQKIIAASYDGYARIWWTPQAIYEWLKTAPVYRLSKREREAFGF